jgi:VanZ family protein
LRRTVFGWGPTVLWAGVLFLLSAWEDPSGFGLLHIPDEILHVGIYSVLGVSLWWARESRPSGSSPFWFILIGWGYGVSDEWHQSFVVGRDAALGDVVSDWFGVALGFGALVVVKRRSQHFVERLEAIGNRD